MFSVSSWCFAVPGTPPHPQEFLRIGRWRAAAFQSAARNKQRRQEQSTYARARMGGVIQQALGKGCESRVKKLHNPSKKVRWRGGAEMRKHTVEKERACPRAAMTLRSTQCCPH
ncbi:hypothetical protein SKAU_G00332520 [Synaphobranchus kaupii]|uniref:Uncharacterized protein n=1 Tax=Synaphobranchus kaupii TaxID=118154 RepID=A0A9Q1ELB7_SYNKA|nr:hypothetical protein SKAU_G00332520 [Synaphobranchus kaupii]